MIPERDIWAAASQLIAREGDGAVPYAEALANLLLENGDREGWAYLRRLKEACQELMRTEPEPGERVS